MANKNTFKVSFQKRGEASDYPLLEINDWLTECAEGRYNVSITHDKTNPQCRLIHACIKEYHDIMKALGYDIHDFNMKRKFKKEFGLGHFFPEVLSNGVKYNDFAEISIADMTVDQATRFINALKHSWYHKFGSNCRSIELAEQKGERDGI